MDRTRPRTPDSLAAVILGNDAVVAARPASPAQLARACVAAGFDMVIPPSWGDEIVAEQYLERLRGLPERTVVACSCRRVRDALSNQSGSHGAREIEVTAPPLAAARYVRLMYGETILVTYVGDCPSADDPTIHARFSPAGFFTSLQRQNIVVGAQPNVWSDTEAQRWQRFRSIPGGVPARRWLARAPIDRVLREVDPSCTVSGTCTERPRTKALLDLSEAAGCVCSGARALVEECEPARGLAPVVSVPEGLDLHHLAPREAPPPEGPTRLEGPHAPDAALEQSDAPADSRRAPISSAELAASSPPDAAAPNGTRSPKTTAPIPLRPDSRLEIAEPTQPERPVRDSRPIANAAGGDRASESRAGRPQRRAILFVLPIVVLGIAAALGATAYRVAASGRTEASPAKGESAPGSVGEQRESDTSGSRSPRRVDSTITPGASRIGTVDTVRRVAPRELSSAGADTAARQVTRRRPRPTAPEVVPGWLPQGAKTWTPADSIRSRGADTSATPKRPGRDTVPRT